MRIGMHLNYAGGFAETVAELADYEKAGLEIVFVPEAYSFDAVSQLGFIAARTERLQIASGIFQLYSRTPALTAMTAAGLDYVSGGRFTLGIGASGPQVIEGWHGVPYDAPVGRTRETDRDLPDGVAPRAAGVRTAGTTRSRCPPDQGTGLGKPLKLINHPVRERIPIMVAALGPKNVALAAELAEGWQPIFYLPGEGRRRVGASRWPRAGPAATPRSAPLDVVAPGPAGHRRRTWPATWTWPGRCWRCTSAGWGRTGTRASNFYYELAVRYGFADAGGPDPGRLPRRPEGRGGRAGPRRAAGRHLADRPGGLVAERLAAMKESGVTTLNVTPLAGTHDDRVRLIEQVRDLTGLACHVPARAGPGAAPGGDQARHGRGRVRPSGSGRLPGRVRRTSGRRGR